MNDTALLASAKGATFHSTCIDLQLFLSVTSEKMSTVPLRM